MSRLALLALLALGACNQPGTSAPAQSEQSNVESVSASVSSPISSSSAAASTGAALAAQPKTMIAGEPPDEGIEAPATHPVDDRCGATWVHHYAHLVPTDDEIESIRKASGAGRIRIIRPGDVVTMDYSETRLNIEVGADGLIKRFRCG